MTILDIDLDLFVTPIARDKRDEDPRLEDQKYSVENEPDVLSFMKDFDLTPSYPIHGSSHKNHIDVCDETVKLVKSRDLIPPFNWIHADAHDDLYGHYSQSPDSSNFMYSLIKNNWINKLTLIYHPDSDPLPQYIVSPDRSTISFDGYGCQFGISYRNESKKYMKPDYIFVAQSPAFTPKKADKIFELLKSYLL